MDHQAKQAGSVENDPNGHATSFLSTTSSARARSEAGTSMLGAWAVLRLITSTYLREYVAKDPRPSSGS
jgi:hypothetical protein